MNIEHQTGNELSIDRNAGQDLRSFLKQIFPKETKSEENGFITSIDKGIVANGEFTNLVYESCINHLVRRLVIAADATREITRKMYRDPEQNLHFINNLRHYLEAHLVTSKEERETILFLLIECIRNQGKPISNGTKRKLRREAQHDNLGCYICGCELDFEDPKKPNFAEFEHVWPNRLGGSSTYINIRMACATCNRIKRNYIDASDFHYEQICLAENVEELERKEQEALREALTEAEAEVVRLEQIAEEARIKAVQVVGDEIINEVIASTVDFLSAKKRKVNVHTEFRREYKIALWAKHNYKCKRCQTDISMAGKLRFRRRDDNDSWHFLNIDGYCETCLIELQRS